jgi:hypothetical protein
VSIVVVGVLLMGSARFIAHSPFFRIRQESDTP